MKGIEGKHKPGRMTTINIILTLAATTTALIAGLFYAYSCSVTLGLGRLPDAEYLSAMQSINRAILNPVFFISFMGTLILLPVTSWMHYGQPVSTRFVLLLAATLIYIIGVFGVTVVGNIPLNNGLDRFNIQAASPEAITNQRAVFEARWNGLNTVRTISSILSVMLVIIACLSDHQSNPARAAE